MVLTPIRLCLCAYAETREFDRPILLLMAICDLNINEEVVFAAVVITVCRSMLGKCYCFQKQEVLVDCLTVQKLHERFLFPLYDNWAPF